MAEYINREKMLKYLDENHAENDWMVNQYNADWIYSFIESQPTADVVEVVRCKDCKYFKHFERCGNWCHRRIRSDIEYHTKLNDFCSYGERRDK